jgi:hypothetical protein
MRALNLDYRRHDTWRQRAGWIGLLLACLVLGDLGWQYRQLARAVEAGEAELARLSAQPRALQSAQGTRQGKTLDEEMRFAREVLLHLDVPWMDLFGAVEASTLADVALLGIEPEPGQEQVNIIGEAKNYPAVLAYARRLEAGAPLSGVHLQNHQIQVQDPEHPVRFTLGAVWRRRP